MLYQETQAHLAGRRGDNDGVLEAATAVKYTARLPRFCGRNSAIYGQCRSEEILGGTAKRQHAYKLTMCGFETPDLL